LPVYEIPYTEYEIPASAAFPKRHSVLRPVLSTRIIHGKKAISCLAIVDSGADNCAFPRSFMDALSLEASIAPREGTIGVADARVETYFCSVTLDFGVIQIPVFAGFTSGLEQSGVGLLGQAGFFDTFNITFRKSIGVFQLELP
jgi:hypothetical protein